MYLRKKRSRGSSGGIVSDYGLDDRAIEVRSRQRQIIFLLAPASRPALGPTQPPIQWVPGVLSPGVKRGRGVMLTTHPHLVPSLRMSRSYASSPPHVPPWRVAGQFYLLLFVISERGPLQLNVYRFKDNLSNFISICGSNFNVKEQCSFDLDLRVNKYVLYLIPLMNL
jgi:hypothetical protein